MVNKIDATDDFDEIARYPEKSEEEINRVLKNWNFERIQSPFFFISSFLVFFYLFMF